MENKVFDRIEKKYLITRQNETALTKLIKNHLDKDSYHKSEVYSLYFDNDNYDLITQSIDWVDFKEKLRARSYAGYDRVFMEIKTKIHPQSEIIKDEEYKDLDNNIGYKRRVMITHDDFAELLKHKSTLEKLAKRSIETKDDLQIAREIDYLITHLDLKPKIMISYKRTSYKDDQGLRITFDEKLKFRDDNLSLNTSKHDKIYFKGNHNIIMEIKSNGAFPLWLVHEMSKLKIYPQKFSKIGKVYELIKKGQHV